MLDPAEARVIEAAKRLLTEIRRADAWIARELEAIPPVAKRCVGQEGPTGLGRVTSPRPRVG